MSVEAEPAETGRGPAATINEVREALSALDDDSHQRLALAARSILNRHPRLTDWEPEDLINFAAQKALEGKRHWYPEGIGFLGFIIGAMRSLASNATRIAAKSAVPTVSYEDLAIEGEDGDRAFLENVPSDSLTPEEELVEREGQARQEAALIAIRAKLADDPVGRQILELRIQDMPKRDIREKLGLTDNEFWTIDRRLTRLIENAAQLETDNK